ncbi:MAG: type II toxin-antitoxin system VapB family antitoxin [Alphaproteobacteria bacterium]|nr:type II toxin-antitoxin system VapB family antitoxin [Alphaproteobacteria bacterium]
MTKTLSIKDQKTAELAHKVAKMRGQTITHTVFDALENMRVMEERRKARKVENLVEIGMEIARHCSSLPLLDTRSEDEILGYDEHGAPTL